MASSEQTQFLEVVDRDTAERRWWDRIQPQPLEPEEVGLEAALGRVLAADVYADVDVPAFDRSNVDGYAIRAEDSFGATEMSPRCLRLLEEAVSAGVVPTCGVAAGVAMGIATGGMLPRGSDAVLMVEHARRVGDLLQILLPIPPGANVTFAATDIARGELVLRKGTRLTARETGVLAALGRGRVSVHRRPQVAVLSTGNELLLPGALPRPAAVYDVNSTTLRDSLREQGADPTIWGIVGDSEADLDQALTKAVNESDLVVVSGGTSKGEGDLASRVLERRRPGIIVHGVALKPGKPVCLGAIGSTPIAILPGFPTSALFTFHEFVAPVVRRMCGLGQSPSSEIEARMSVRHDSDQGRTEYLLVGLLPGPQGPVAYPMGKGSGSITSFSAADGFTVIPKNQQFIERGELVRVVPLGKNLTPADLVVSGSHCLGLDLILGLLAERGIRIKTMWIGSQGGLEAAARGECDLAGIHLLDPTSQLYNRPFMPETVRLQAGYFRMQGVVCRQDDPRFDECPAPELIENFCKDASCHMVNRNRGSGTRVLIDELLRGRRPPGYAVEVRSHHAVAAAVSQRRADWGLAIKPVAALYGLAFQPLREECYDFAIPAERWDRPAVAAFRALLSEPDTHRRLREFGFTPSLQRNA
jgi:putative molybdopterin biosynthesis protein